MAEQPAAEKTEQPTPRRLQKAREEGQVPQSQEMTTAISLIALLLTLALLAPGLLHWFRQQMESGLSGGTSPFTDSEAFIRFLNGTVIDTTVVMLPVMGVLMVSGIASGILVGGWSFSPGGLRIKWNAINPATVVGNLLSMRSLVRLLASVAKLCFVSIIVWLYLRDKLDALAVLRWAWSAQIMAAMAKIVFGLALRVGIAVLVIGIADTLYQKWQYLQELRMTRQELKLERKDSDGSPEVKSRIRRIQVEMSMKRLKQQVPKANVILVNPTHVAVALKYDAKTMESPMLLAKGADHMAEHIIKIGRSYGVPIVRRPEVARAIYAGVKPGQPIPESLYVAVAEVLAMLYRLRQKKGPARER